MSDTKSINWNQMSELGLICCINREILHPLGLAISRNPKTGSSDEILVSSDGVWEYAPGVDNDKLSDEQIKAKIREWSESSDRS